ncbi:flippase [Halocatena salina]|uniref:Flippase n=1 Tax=Halocatena salina TaxID=2934340 RepID=A0A8U0A612_9EURY|nr:flippase [Halocatena salina]UPM43938.1 flippase [Halocatena salina]
MSEQTTSESTVSPLRSIVDGASIFLVGEILYKASGFVLNFLLARTLGSTLYGIYTYAYTYITVSTMFASLGSDQAVLRYFPSYSDDEDAQSWIAGISVLSSVIGSCVVAGMLWVLAPTIRWYTGNSELFVDVMRIIAIMLPFDTLTKMLASMFRGLEHPTEQIFLQKIVRPGARICAVGVALLLGYTLIDTVAALVVASVLAFVIGVVLLVRRTSLRPSFSGMSGTASTPEITAYYNYSLPLMLSKAGTILYNRVDVFMVGLLIGMSSTGYYNIAFLMSSAITLPLTGCNQLFAPIASRLYDNGEVDELNEIYATVTRWAFTLALFAALGAIVYAPDILSLIDDEYTVAVPVLSLFAVGQLLNASVGPSNYLLMMTDHQYVTFVNHWVFGVVNVVLNFIFILQFGLIGAALATASILGLLNVVRWIEIRYLEGLSPYSRAFYKPLVAGVGATGALYLPTLWLSEIPLLVVGGSLGAVVYGLILYALGIEQSDITFARQMIESR